MRLLIPLFSPSTGTWGGLTRGLAVANAARQAGHQVAFCTTPGMSTGLSAHGYPVYPLPPSTLFGLPAPLSRRLEKRSQHVTLPVKPGRSVGSIWLVYVLSGLGRVSYLSRLLDAQLNAVRAFRPTAIFTDIDPGAYLLAAVTGLPIASTYAGIVAHGQDSLPGHLFARAANAALRRHHLPARSLEELCSGSHILKIIPSIPELDGTDPARPDVRYIGHLLGDLQPRAGEFSPEPGKRYVFAYLGTGSLSLDTLERVLPQVFPASGDTICLVGSQSITSPRSVGGVEFRPYVPAEAVLPHCDWTLCHGGQNTILQSLRQGVPLLVFPGPIFERRFNASKVAENQAGFFGELNEFTPQRLAEMLSAQVECAAAARRLSQRICSYEGAPAAIAALETWS